MDGPNRKPGPGKPGRPPLDKAGRLAEALRENLRRRKAQLRSRARRGDTEMTGSRPENDTETGEER